MSDDVLRVIPRDPAFVPHDQAQQKAVELLRALLPDAGEIHVSVSDEITFFDQGSSLASVSCSHCRSVLEMKWFWDAMGAAYRTRFLNRLAKPPCCGREVDLNDLVYDWPAGFGRFALEARSPGIVADLDGELIADLEGVLGCDLRQTWARY